MAKKFKLVYEEKGGIKGSYSGFPGKEDTYLIEKEVLEGTKEPSPTPSPDEPVDNEKSLAEFKTCLEEVASISIDTDDIKINKIFKFKNFDYYRLGNIWTELDTEAVKQIQQCLPESPDPEYTGKLHLNYTGTLTPYGTAEATSENSFDFFCTSVSIETDAETGDSWITTGAIDYYILFSGSIQVIYNAE